MRVNGDGVTLLSEVYATRQSARASADEESRDRVPATVCSEWLPSSCSLSWCFSRSEWLPLCLTTVAINNTSVVNEGRADESLMVREEAGRMSLAGGASVA
jgi:hypothetical protein